VRLPSSSGLLLFAEGRRFCDSDTDAIDVVYKRSDDDGRTWSPLAVLWSEFGPPGHEWHSSGADRTRFARRCAWR
jgi:hypothetical protein